MKQKKINNILYVFQVTPYEITEDTDADIIKVQLESYDGFIALNQSIKSKFAKYNYNMFTVQQQEWAPYVDEPDLVDPELAWSAESANAVIGETNTYPTLTNPHSVTVTYESTNTDIATVNQSTGAVTLVDPGNCQIKAVFAGNEVYTTQTVSYSLVVKEIPDLAWSSNSATVTIGADDNVFPTLTNTDGVTVTYASSDTSVATINESTGAISLVAAGSTTISAVFAGNTLYVAKTVTYTLTVEEAAAPKVTVTYNIGDISSAVNVYGYIGGMPPNDPDAMIVDGVSETLSSTYLFDTTGTHTIEFVFNDGRFDIVLDEDTLQNDKYNVITDVTVGPDITGVLDYSWSITAYLYGQSDIAPLPLTYLPVVPPTIISSGHSYVQAPAASVYVPADSVTAYQTATAWSEISALITAIQE